MLPSIRVGAETGLLLGAEVGLAVGGDVNELGLLLGAELGPFVGDDVGAEVAFWATAACAISHPSRRVPSRTLRFNRIMLRTSRALKLSSLGLSRTRSSY